MLVYRDDTGAQRFVPLEGKTSSTIGRSFRMRRPAGLGRAGVAGARGTRPRRSDWTLVDDGLSRNGTFLNGDRLAGRRRLRGQRHLRARLDVVPLPGHQPGDDQLTKVGEQLVTAASLSPTQRQIVTALCRPYKHDDPYATPASNQQIADELFLSVDAVKTQLRACSRSSRSRTFRRTRSASSWSSASSGSASSAAGTSVAPPPQVCAIDA